MIENAKYVHSNIVARDWRALARFYEKVFGAVPVPPERDISGDKIDAVTGLSGVHVRGVHLKLPGYGQGGPTLEIFEYNKVDDCSAATINRPGFAHIAFSVDSVEQARDEMLTHGGSALGDLVTLSIATGAKVILIYMKDPEGNIVELQSWES